MLSSIAHPQLKKPPLVEALFELRYQPAHGYGVVPGQLYERLRPGFPTLEELPAATLPLRLPDVPPLMRHRFYREDKGALVQTGDGLVSINHISYSQFEELDRDLRTVLEHLGAIGAVTATTRFGLRYINRIPLDRATNELITIDARLPDEVVRRIEQRQLKFLLDWEQRGAMTLAIDVGLPPGQVTIDLDAYLQEDRAFDVDGILAWVTAVHQNIYDIFRSTLTDDYWREIS